MPVKPELAENNLALARDAADQVKSVAWDHRSVLLHKVAVDLELEQLQRADDPGMVCRQGPEVLDALLVRPLAATPLHLLRGHLFQRHVETIPEVGLRRNAGGHKGSTPVMPHAGDHVEEKLVQVREHGTYTYVRDRGCRP